MISTKVYTSLDVLIITKVVWMFFSNLWSPSLYICHSYSLYVGLHGSALFFTVPLSSTINFQMTLEILQFVHSLLKWLIPSRTEKMFRVILVADMSLGLRIYVKYKHSNTLSGKYTTQKPRVQLKLHNDD